ncbi:MAG: hypothetical protein K2Z81_08665 [Cyanobacteria bacterium]|nr:hypothetical protein [Cyanobacteriota bacterium]
MTTKSIFTALMSLVVLAMFSGMNPAQAADEEKKEPTKKVKVKKAKKEKKAEETKAEGSGEEKKEAAPE